MDEKKKIITVDLTDDQHDRLWIDRKAIDKVGEIVGAALVEASERAAKRDKLFWDVVYKLAGADEKTHKVQVDWINRKVIAKPIDE